MLGQKSSNGNVCVPLENKIIKKSRHIVFKLLNQFYSGEGEKILLKEKKKKKIRKLLSEAALEQISSLKDPSLPTVISFLH